MPLGLLAAAGFLSVAGARIVDPLLAPIAHEFGATVPAVSVIIGAFTLPYGFSQLMLGPLGDRCGKLRVMLGALLGYAIFTSACASATGLPELTLLRACAGATSAGLIPVCLAYIGDAVPYDRRQLTLSRFATGIVFAQILAGPLGGAVGEWVGWRAAFLLLGATGLGVATTLAVRLRHLPDHRRDGRPATAGAYRALLARSDARLLLAATAAEGALTGGVFPFVAPYLHARFGLSYAIVGLVIACFGLGALLCTRLARYAVPRIEEARLALAGAMLAAAALAVLAASRTWLAFVPGQAAIGFGYLLMHTVLQARATELAPAARSTKVALFVFALFLGQAVGSLGFGAAVAAFGYRATFLGGAAGLAGLGGALWSVMRRLPAPMQPA